MHRDDGVEVPIINHHQAAGESCISPWGHITRRRGRAHPLSTGVISDDDTCNQDSRPRDATVVYLSMSVDCASTSLLRMIALIDGCHTSAGRESKKNTFPYTPCLVRSELSLRLRLRYRGTKVIRRPLSPRSATRVRVGNSRGNYPVFRLLRFPPTRDRLRGEA